MKKKIDPERKRLTKLRAALRNVWQYDPLRKAVIAQAVEDFFVSDSVENLVAYTQKYPKGKHFVCPVCRQPWPVEMATVDHEPELGGFTLETIGDWTMRLFFGPQRALCKPCHASKARKKS